ncbi:hypothetical protein, partial [Pseudomonas silesiensis]|uniref:hypothetical protein n=1 Tax=Pseudomonas silesiensis TaxID=1853130 RepID=UPI0034D757B1
LNIAIFLSGFEEYVKVVSTLKPFKTWELIVLFKVCFNKVPFIVCPVAELCATTVVEILNPERTSLFEFLAVIVPSY